MPALTRRRYPERQDLCEVHPGRRRAVHLMAARGWKRKFEDPIPLPDGRKLITLRDAAIFITSLPKTEAVHPEWQAAIEALMLVAERNGPTMLARIGVMRALNRGHVREFNTSRKDPHWGRRKLKRNQSPPEVSSKREFLRFWLETFGRFSLWLPFSRDWRLPMNA
jgi:hypothetical protein